MIDVLLRGMESLRREGMSSPFVAFVSEVQAGRLLAEVESMARFRAVEGKEVEVKAPNLMGCRFLVLLAGELYVYAVEKADGNPGYRGPDDGVRS